jgi:V/A-type H+-transporting ATPase subunit E
MSHKEFLKALEADAKKEIESVVKEALTEAEEIINQTVHEKEGKKELFRKNLRLSLEKENTKVINRAKKAARKEILELQQGIIDEIFAEAEKRLINITSSDYAVTELLLAEALQKLDGSRASRKIYIYTSKDEFEALSKAKPLSMADRSVEFKVTGNNKKMQGITLTTEDGRITVNNSFEARLKKIKKSLLPPLNKILFTESS